MFLIANKNQLDTHFLSTVNFFSGLLKTDQNKNQQDLNSFTSMRIEWVTKRHRYMIWDSEREQWRQCSCRLQTLSTTNVTFGRISGLLGGWTTHLPQPGAEFQICRLVVVQFFAQVMNPSLVLSLLPRQALVYLLWGSHTHTGIQTLLSKYWMENFQSNITFYTIYI